MLAALGESYGFGRRAATLILSQALTGRKLVSWVLSAWAGLSLCQTEAFAGGPACPDPNALYAQCPNFAPNGAEGEYYTYSDVEADVSLAGNFTLQGEGSIQRIRWWGTYLALGSDAGCGPPDPGDFTILLWRDADGNPAGPDPLAIPGQSVTRSSQPVGTVPAALGPAVVFE